MRILAICGSLRLRSYNQAVLREIETRIAEDSNFVFFERLAEVPSFNPDQESIPDSVQNLRDEIRDADAVVVATPEYVHGVPGALKNALDWVVGSGEWDSKPTLIINVTPSAMEPQFVRENLSEILSVMSGGNLLKEASFVVTAAFKKFDASGRVIDSEVLRQIDEAVKALQRSFVKK